MSGNESNWRSWVKKADSDLLNIRNNMAAPAVPWDTVCFHAQQAAEKMLKAFLAFRGRQPPHTHDLLMLLGECMEFAPSLSDLSDDCALLTPYAIEARYPGLHEATEEEGQLVVAVAEHLCAAVQRLLPPEP